MNLEKCKHETIGRGMIQHGGISHPGGEQICLDCRKPMREIISESYQKGYKDGLHETAIKVDKSMIDFMDTLPGQKLIEDVRKKIKEQPMGVSQWKLHGVQNGYWDFFLEEINKKQNDKE